MNHVFLVPKELDSWSKKCHFRSIFGSFPWNFHRKFFFWKNLIAPKHSSLNFRGSLLNYRELSCVFPSLSEFQGIFGSLLPARAVTVNQHFLIPKSVLFILDWYFWILKSAFWTKKCTFFNRNELSRKFEFSILMILRLPHP